MPARDKVTEMHADTLEEAEGAVLRVVLPVRLDDAVADALTDTMLLAVIVAVEQSDGLGVVELLSDCVILPVEVEVTDMLSVTRGVAVVVPDTDALDVKVKEPLRLDDTLTPPLLVAVVLEDGEVVGAAVTEPVIEAVSEPLKEPQELGDEDPLGVIRDVSDTVLDVDALLHKLLVTLAVDVALTAIELLAVLVSDDDVVGHTVTEGDMELLSEGLEDAHTLGVDERLCTPRCVAEAVLDSDELVQPVGDVVVLGVVLRVPEDDTVVVVDGDMEGLAVSLTVTELLSVALSVPHALGDEDTLNDTRDVNEAVLDGEALMQTVPVELKLELTLAALELVAVVLKDADTLGHTVTVGDTEPLRDTLIVGHALEVDERLSDARCVAEAVLDRVKLVQPVGDVLMLEVMLMLLEWVGVVLNDGEPERLGVTLAVNELLRVALVEPDIVGLDTLLTELRNVGVTVPHTDELTLVDCDGVSEGLALAQLETDGVAIAEGLACDDSVAALVDVPFHCDAETVTVAQLVAVEDAVAVGADDAVGDKVDEALLDEAALAQELTLALAVNDAVAVAVALVEAFPEALFVGVLVTVPLDVTVDVTDEDWLNALLPEALPVAVVDTVTLVVIVALPRGLQLLVPLLV